MTTSMYDCVVVGTGVIGSWTGYHLAKQGYNTLMLDQYMLPNTRGSSGGHSRIIRMAYNKDCYCQMMPETYKWWLTLEKDTGLELYKKTGLMIIQRNDKKGNYEESKAYMDKYGFPYKELTSDDLRRDYPGLKYNDQFKALLDINGGLLLPGRCLQALHGEFKRMGGKIQDGEKVLNIIPGSKVKIVTSKGTYLANKVVIAAGPWSKDVLATMGINVPVRTMPGLSVFFKEKDQANPLYGTARNFPITYEYLSYEPDNYRFATAFTSYEYPGMVKMVTRGEPPPYYCHPDDRDTRGHGELVSILQKYMKEHLPGLDPNPAIMEPCVYSMTPDRDYIIDKHPSCDNIVFGAGFSGHGYMRAPMIGLLLTQMVNKKPESFDTEHYKLKRFKVKSNL